MPRQSSQSPPFIAELDQRHRPQVHAADVRGIDLKSVIGGIQRFVPTLAGKQRVAQQVPVFRMAGPAGKPDRLPRRRLGFRKTIPLLKNRPRCIMGKRIIRRPMNRLLRLGRRFLIFFQIHQAQAQERVGMRLLRRFGQKTLQLLRGEVKPPLGIKKLRTLIGGMDHGRAMCS